MSKAKTSSPAPESFQTVENLRLTVGSFIEMQHAAYLNYESEYRDRAPDSHEIEEVKTRRTIEETLDDFDDIPENLFEAIERLTQMLNKIPIESRNTATLSNYGEDGYYATITYRRPETDEEWAARRSDVERRLKIAVARTEASDRAEFERLQAKFGKIT